MFGQRLEIGLDGAIQSLVDRFSEQSGIKSRIRIDKRAANPEMHRAETLFRIVEEALHNIERHSQADHVSVRIAPVPMARHEKSSGRFRLSIADDGKGFNPHFRNPGHYGLRGMAEQAALIDGEFAISSEAGRGTTVSINFCV